MVGAKVDTTRLPERKGPALSTSLKPLSATGMDLLFRNARTASSFTDAKVTDAQIKQIYDLNMQIRNAAAVSSGGAQNSGLQDQRDIALGELAKMMDIKSVANPDGSMNVATADGVNLVSNTYAQLAYVGGAQNGTYGSITTQARAVTRGCTGLFGRAPLCQKDSQHHHTNCQDTNDSP